MIQNFIIFIIGLITGIVITFVIFKLMSKNFYDINEKMKITFENISNKILKDNTTEFSNTSKEKISELLMPFKEKLDELKVNFDSNIEKFAVLDSRISDVVAAEKRIKEDTSNLSNTLKGNNQIQGKWGELILERVFEISGLKKGEEYLLQMHIEGRPDAVILLPKNRVIFIDAKTTISSYDAYNNAINTEQKNEALKQFNKSLKIHIDGLSKRKYQEYENYNSPDYVLMFIPIESCYSLLFENNSELWEYAWQKKVMPVSPTTLLAALKIINHFYQIEQQNKNADLIVKTAQEMIGKIAEVIKDVIIMQNSLDDIKTKLTGKNNVTDHIEKMKELGAKNSKEIPEIKS